MVVVATVVIFIIEYIAVAAEVIQGHQKQTLPTS